MLIDNVIGIVGAVYKGNYSSTTTYEYLNVVTHDGSSYICIKEEGCTGITPTNETYWQLMAKKGEFTEQDKEEFKQAVVEESKTAINEHTETKKTEIDNYTTEQKTSLKNELDEYKNTKETELDTHKTTLETEMTNTKDSLIEEIKTAQNGFDENATAKTTAFNNNATEKTNTFNSNVTAKIEEFDENTNTKKTEYNENATAKLEEYNNNHTAKMNEFNENAESYEKRITELETERDEIAVQMPWNTTDIQESIHISDSAKYSRNKLSIFGNLKQETRSGKNILALNNCTAEYFGVTVTTKDDGTITINGTATAQINKKDWELKVKEKYKANTDYTFSAFYVSGDASHLESSDFYQLIFNIRRKTTENNEEGSLTTNLTTRSSNANTLYNKNKSTTKNSTAEEGYLNNIQVIISEGSVFNNLTYKLQLEEGSTSTEFEQYGAMPSINYPSMPVVATGVQKIKKIGKNFIPYPYAENSKSTYGIQYTANEDGSIAVSGTSTNPACDFYLYGSSTDTGEYLYIKKGTYSIADTNMYNVLYIAREKTLGTLVGVAKIKQALASQDCYFYGYFLRVEKDITVNATFYPQIELNDTETSYEPYNGEEITLDLGTTELCKITDAEGNVVAQDKAVYREVDGVWKWQWEKNVTKIIFDGSENWKKSSNTSNTIFYVYNIGSFLTDTRTKVSCNFFTGKIVWNKDEIGIELFDTSNLRVGLGLSAEITTADEWKSWLNEHNMVLYYIKDTSTYEDCTAEQSKVLDKLYKLSLEKGTNNIFVESENGVTTELQLEYMQDNNLIKEQEHKEFEDRITAIENLLSTTTTSAMLLDNLQTDLESEVK